MPVKRPTFHESWYRIAAICPRLRATIQVQRQFYRGRKWHILRDPANNDHFRVSESGYQFLALLDGKRTIEQAWTICLDTLGDDAPTQGEVVQLLGQLYTSNLLRGDLPPDAEGLFQRLRKRQFREVGGYLSNLLFLRIPLFDPDRILEGLVKVFGWVFSWIGLLLWIGVVGAGVHSLSGRWGELTDQASNVLDPGNLLWLYACFAGIKAIHEFGHGLACKKFGKAEGAGEVHTIGIMLLVLTPMPYIDATSSWSLRSRWKRLMVAGAGMFVELAVAAVAAMIWASTASGTTAHALSYNVMFIASVSTLLFNANPLLRYDGYYILSDLIEIPNLYNRAKQYLYYLVKRYVYGVRNPVNPAHTAGEKAWFFPYSIASFVYRIFICANILLFVADKLFFLGVILAVMSIVAWVLVPIWKFMKYLATSGELTRHRVRAVGSTVIVIGGLLWGLGQWSVSDSFTCEGVVEPVTMAIIHTGGDGELQSCCPSDVAVEAGETILLVSRNPEGLTRCEELRAELEETRIRQRLAQSERKLAEVKMHGVSIVALEKQLARNEAELSKLTVRAPINGIWLAPRIDASIGSRLARGEAVGMVVDFSAMRIRCVVNQNENARLSAKHENKSAIQVCYRLAKRGDLPPACATIERIVPVGQTTLPSAALGYLAGGNMAVKPNDPKGRTTNEQFFEVHLLPAHAATLRPGQKVIVRYDLPVKPLLAQWGRRFQQIYLKRFQN